MRPSDQKPLPKPGVQNPLKGPSQQTARDKVVPQGQKTPPIKPNLPVAPIKTTSSNSCPPNKRVCATLIDSFVGMLIGPPFLFLGSATGTIISSVIYSG
ncbi:MAG: hypothetical protein HQM08_01365 [Candidatus Riflebacteria bacterium]|nr:hypothetical protein [Candidatus Riflebacteria bacterium]